MDRHSPSPRSLTNPLLGLTVRRATSPLLSLFDASRLELMSINFFQLCLGLDFALGTHRDIDALLENSKSNLCSFLEQAYGPCDGAVTGGQGGLAHLFSFETPSHFIFCRSDPSWGSEWFSSDKLAPTAPACDGVETTSHPFARSYRKFALTERGSPYSSDMARFFEDLIVGMGIANPDFMVCLAQRERLRALHGRAQALAEAAELDAASTASLPSPSQLRI